MRMGLDNLVQVANGPEFKNALDDLQVTETIRMLSESSKVIDSIEQREFFDLLLNEALDGRTISNEALDDVNARGAFKKEEIIRKLSASVKIANSVEQNKNLDQSQTRENDLEADPPEVSATEAKTFFNRTLNLTLRVFRFFSKYFGFPLGMQSGKFVVSKRPLWSFMFLLFTLRTLYFQCILAIATFNRWPILDEFQAVWTGIYMVVFSTCWGFAFLLLIRHVDDMALLWNAFIQLKPNIRKLKPQILFMYFYPPAMTTTTLCIGTFSTLMPSLISQFRFIVFYCYRSGYITSDLLYGILTVIALLADWITLFMFGAIVNCVFATHITFFEVWNQLALSLIKGTRTKLETSKHDLQNLFHQVRILEVLLKIFNISNSAAILQMKFCLLSLSIASISCLILFSFENPVVVVILLYIGIVHTLAYPALYINAFAVSANLMNFKLATRHRDDWCVGNPLVHKRLEAISTIGVWVGSIRTFEQESVILYVDFVFSKILDIVLTWR